MKATATAANASAPRAAHAPNAIHVTKPPRSNRQNLARLEIVVTPSQQSPDPFSNRQFLRPPSPLPWTQLIHEALQLQLPGHSLPFRRHPARAHFATRDLLPPTLPRPSRT